MVRVGPIVGPNAPVGVGCHRPGCGGVLGRSDPDVEDAVEGREVADLGPIRAEPDSRFVRIAEQDLARDERNVIYARRCLWHGPAEPARRSLPRFTPGSWPSA